MDNATSTPNTKKVNQRSKTQKKKRKIIMDDFEHLRIYTYEDEAFPKESQKVDLSQTVPEEIEYFREKRVPSFVFKVNENLYHGTIPKRLDSSDFESLNSKGHKCQFCRRLSAASDKDGGCEKVRRIIKKIEDYPWITRGYYTFGTTNELFVVLECQHFEPFKQKKEGKSCKTEARKLFEIYYGIDL